MSAKKVYTCDLCREKIKDPEKSLALYFSDLTKFTLGGYSASDGTHICQSCARQLKKHLNTPEISLFLEKHEVQVANND